MLLVCAVCTTKYATGLRACPYCRSLDHYEDGAPTEEGLVMPKISRYGGTTEQGNPALQPATDTVEEGGQPPGESSSETSSVSGEQPSPGSSSPALMAESPAPGPEEESPSVVIPRRRR